MPGGHTFALWSAQPCRRVQEALRAHAYCTATVSCHAALQGYGALARTGSSTGGSTPVGSGTVTPGAAQAALAAGAQALLALPGQLPYRCERSFGSL